MGSKAEVHKTIVNGRLLKNYGSWMYCSGCNKTVGYLCYSTYQYFKFSFTCGCGTSGSFELGEKPISFSEAKTQGEFLVKRNRFCCPIDAAPLFSAVEKNIEYYSCEVICNQCLNTYSVKG